MVREQAIPWFCQAHLIDVIVESDHDTGNHFIRKPVFLGRIARKLLYCRIGELHIGTVVDPKCSAIKFISSRGCGVKKLSLAMALAIPLVSFVAVELSFAADAEIIVRQKTVRHYRDYRVVEECGWRRCPPRCPDRYSCAPLYGHYGPWGGEQYWASYSYVPYGWPY